HLIDEEVRNFIDRNYDRAMQLLTDNMDKLHAMAKALIKFETIDADQIDDIMGGRPPRVPRDWDDDEEQGAGGGEVKASGPSSGDGHIGGPAGEH
ncbi:MAG: ATP-dependent metalloprotease, partial [Pseudomonadota bacterium]|nr:ATP-dependent metalloprotease [Pseudomonadota bacterium]